MNRRDMLKAGLAAGAVVIGPRAASAQAVFAPVPKGWRSFVLTARVEPTQGATKAWIPLPTFEAADWQRPGNVAWTGKARTAERVRDPKYGADMLRVEWAADQLNPVVEVTAQVQTQDRAVRPGQRSVAPLSDAERTLSLAATELLPTGGIVREMALDITRGKRTDVAQARALYDWVVEQAGVPCHPQQIEFARLNLSHTVMSKRKLLALVEKRLVSGWDDPRLPTLQGLRRRGYTPEAIRAFCEHIGVAKRDGVVEMALLEHFIREDLNRRASRVMGVLRPLKIVIDNYPEGQVEQLDAVNNPEDPSAGVRTVPFSRTLYIEQDDFREVPPPKYFRLTPGREVRLRYGYIIQCVDVVKDPTSGEVVEVHCTYDPETRSGGPQAQRKVKSTIHWVSAVQAQEAEVRLYEHLLSQPTEGAGDFTTQLNPHSLQVLTGCKVEPSLASAAPGSRYQFERQGYFCVDTDSSPSKLIFNRTVSLRDSWAKIEKAQQKT